jgi:hypothetical protein
MVDSILCLLNIAENGAWGKIGAVDINTEDERQIDSPRCARQRNSSSPNQLCWDFN